MYRELNKKEVQEFVHKYFLNWEKDIHKITCISYQNEIEYLINDHYMIKSKRG